MDCGCGNKEHASKELVPFGGSYRHELQWNVMVGGHV